MESIEAIELNAPVTGQRVYEPTHEHTQFIFFLFSCFVVVAAAAVGFFFGYTRNLKRPASETNYTQNTLNTIQ